MSDEQIRSLNTALSAAQNFSQHLDGWLLLIGSYGVGKTHLAAALAAEATARGCRVYLGMGQSIAWNMAYAPWRQILHALLGLDTTDFRETAASAPPAKAGTAVSQIAQVEAAINRLNPEWHIRLPLLGDLLGLPIPDNATTAAFDPRLRQDALFALVVD